jgi:O-antigen ligase
MTSATLSLSTGSLLYGRGIEVPRARFGLCAMLLATSLVLGGGGSPAPAAELAVELAALAACAAWFALPAPAPACHDRVLLAGAALLAAIPLLQLLPLPPQLWQALPGRETATAALRVAGAADGWMPLSLTPARTLASALSLISPLVVAGFVARTSASARTKLLGLVLAGAALSAIIGVVQLASGSSGSLRFYGSTGFSYASGLFANRNANADLLLVGLLAMLALAAAQPKRLRGLSARIAWGTLALFLLLSVVLTRSRAGMVLTAVPLFLAPVLLKPWLRRRLLTLAASTINLGLAGLLAIQGNAALRHSWDRFTLDADNRADLRADTLYAIGKSWPVGTGLGSFVPVVESAERLETVDATRPNRAHNDYLEFTLEAGLAAPLLLVAAAAAIVARVTRLLRSGLSEERRAQVGFALGTLSIFALHALVDYPLRAMALACVAALAVGMLAHPPQQEEEA